GRFKMPWQLGTWPAFWTLQDGWPPEIDIFEVPHERNLHHYYLHYTKTDWYASHGSAWDHEASFGGTHTGPDKSADFHTYGLEWTSSYLKFYFDDKVIATYNRPTEISQLKGNYIIINLAVGGWAGDNIQVTNANPAYLECDWVRVWKKDASEMIPSDKVKVMSVSEGKCMSGVTGDLSLVDCNSDDAWINLFEQYSGTFRLNISGKVLEIGGESKEDGAKAGIWDWNGGGHQQFAFEKQPNYTANVVTMMARHSEKYLQVGKDGTIFQAPLPDDKSALWRIFQPGEEIVTSADELKSGDQVRFIDNKLVWSGEEQQKMLVEVYDSRGVCCMVDEIGGGKTEVSLQMLPTGIYFITINGGMVMKIRK
ncbi:MAG: family 16 glycosylhydrolase, partial [Bacteroidales bacterium]|nr:family 16 glycosylhydrolase [Bacteroidales bacterium]